MALTQISTQGIKDGTITGSDLATNVDLVDNQKLRLGTGNDLQIYHSGSDSWIRDIGTGNLYLDTQGAKVAVLSNATETMANFIKDGAVELYFNNSKKFETTSSGVNVTDSDGSVNIKLTNNSGTAAFVYADGTNTGFLDSQAHFLVKGIKDGAVELFFDNSKKFQTLTDGVKVSSDNASLEIQGASSGTSTAFAKFKGYRIVGDIGRLGELQFINQRDNDVQAEIEVIANGDTNSYFDFKNNNAGLRTLRVQHDGTNLPDNMIARFGNSSDLQIYHDGSNSFAVNTGGQLLLRSTTGVQLGSPSGEPYVIGVENGQVELYHDNTKMFETTSDGATLQKGLTVRGVQGGEAQIRIEADEADNATDRFRLVATDSAGFHIQSYDGSQYDTLLKAVMNGGVELFHNNSRKFATVSSGNHSYGQMTFDGRIYPNTDNAFECGLSNRRWTRINAVNGSINTSDKTEKNTIVESDLGLDFINKLKPISFKWNKDDGKTHYGLIAQDVEETIIELGKSTQDFGGIDKQEDSPMGLGYCELISPLIKAIQELSAEVASLKAS